MEVGRPKQEIRTQQAFHKFIKFREAENRCYLEQFKKNPAKTGLICILFSGTGHESFRGPILKDYCPAWESRAPG